MALRTARLTLGRRGGRGHAVLVAAEDVAQAELVAHELLDDVVERQVNSDRPRLLVPVLADVDVVGGAPPDNH